MWRMDGLAFWFGQQICPTEQSWISLSMGQQKDPRDNSVCQGGREMILTHFSFPFGAIFYCFFAPMGGGLLGVDFEANVPHH